LNYDIIYRRFKKNYLVLSLIFIFIISRLLIFSLGIEPDPKWIGSLMQHISLNLLKDDLFGSLFYFHSQPPLWNFIIGLGAKLLGNNPLKVSYYILFFNLISSICIIFFSVKVLELIKVKKKKNIFFNINFNYFITINNFL